MPEVKEIIQIKQVDKNKEDKEDQKVKIDKQTKDGNASELNAIKITDQVSTPEIKHDIENIHSIPSTNPQRDLDVVQNEISKHIINTVDLDSNDEKQNDDQPKVPQEKLPTPIIKSGVNNGSFRSQYGIESNDFSVANLTSDSHEWNLDSNKRGDNQIDQKPTVNPQREVKQPPVEPTIPTEAIKPKSNQSTEMKPANVHISEELEESQIISSMIENAIVRKDSLADSRSQFNKFQNVEYEKKQNEEEVESEIEEYGDDFVEDADIPNEKRQSIDLDAVKNTSLGYLNASHPKREANRSLAQQSIDRQIEKFLQTRSSNIEENIVDEFSLETKRVRSGNTIEEESAIRYNDFAVSNSNRKPKEESIGENYAFESVKESLKSSMQENSQRLYESRTSDIKEEIVEGDSDGYNPVEYDI